MSPSKITTVDQYAEELKKGMGKVYVNEWGLCMGGPKFPKPWAFNTEVTLDSIRHFVDAIGDLNPLFRDREYAKRTRYGCLVAPPPILYGVAYGHYPDPPGFPPLRDFPNLYGGDEYEWFSPICEGDKIDWKTTYPTDIQVKPTKSIGTVAFAYGKHEFSRQGGVPIATCKFWQVIYSAPQGAERRKRYVKPVYTEEYIREVYAAQDREIVRGSESRFWEDVAVGEELPPVVRGPYTVMDNVAWIAAANGEIFFVSDRLWRIIHEHSGWGVYDPDWKVYRNLHDHFDVSSGRGGLGSQRTAWADMVLTNWIGDDGFIWKLRTEHKYGRYGNVYWCKSKVTRKYCSEGRCCVDIDCRIENQTGELTLDGNATVLLPSREHGPVTYPSPRPMSATNAARE